MRTITKIPTPEKLKRSAPKDQAFAKFLKTEIEDSISEHSGLYTRFTDYIRMYRGIPIEEFSKDPIPVRNIEVTVAATACDTLFSQAWDMIMSQSPITSVRETNVEFKDGAKGLQTLVNHLAIDPFTNFIPSSKDYMTDCIWLGTGFYYTTWQEDHRKTGLDEIVDWGPRHYSPAPEDILVPGGALPDIQSLRLIGFRTSPTEGELQCRGMAGKWDWKLAEPTKNINPVRLQRQKASHVTDADHALIRTYELYDLFVSFDYDGDGYDEDLYCIYDRTSAKILLLTYIPFDIRPFSVARYQYQPHSFWGMGTIEMDAPYETEITNWHNFRMANAKLVNSRAWGVKSGSPMSGTKLRIIPNKPLYFNEVDDIKEFRMADIYPSVLQYEQADMQLAERRVGTMTEFTANRPGHRTPGMTMLSLLQQINRRFTTAFEEIRSGMSDAQYQSIIRIQEVYKKDEGGYQAKIDEFLQRLLGRELAEAVAAILRGEPRDTRDKIVCEMSASSQSVNREADKQSAMQMLQVLNGYYQQVVQMAMMVVNPQAPPPIKKICTDIVIKMSESMDRFLRTFDNVRDPTALLFTEEAFNALISVMGPNAGGPPSNGGLPNMASGAEAGGSEQDGGSQDMGAGDMSSGMGGGDQGSFPLSGNRS